MNERVRLNRWTRDCSDWGIDEVIASPDPKEAAFPSVRPGDHPSDPAQWASSRKKQASRNSPWAKQWQPVSFYFEVHPPPWDSYYSENQPQDREAISYPIPMSYSKSLDRLVERGYDQREEGLGRWGEGLIILTRPDLFILTRRYKPHPSLLVRVHKKGLKIDGKKGPCFTGVKVSTTYVEMSFFR